MKKIVISFFIIAVLLLLSSCVQDEEGVNGKMILEYVVGSRELTEKQLIEADINGDGMVNVADAILFMQSEGKENGYKGD